MIGQKLGQYRITRKIGQGGMGVVYEAVHEHLSIRAAVKVLFGDRPDDEVQVERFIAEARAASKVHHSSLVRLFDFGRHIDGTVYMMMEYLDGQTLRERLVQSRARLPHRQVLVLLRQVASALAVVHQAGIVHRDLSPANIMLVADGEVDEGERAKVLDFGIAQIRGEGAGVAGARAIAGTPRYMSPEQFAGLPLDDSTDVYSLGIILFELLTGESPYASEGRDRDELRQAHLQEKPRSLRSTWPEAPTELVALLHAMLAKDPQERPPMAEVSETLASVGDQLSSTDMGAPLLAAGPEQKPAPVETQTGTIAPSTGGKAVPSDRSRWPLLALLAVAALTGALWQRVASRAAKPPHISGMAYLAGGAFLMGSTDAEIDSAFREALKVEPKLRRTIYEREQPRRSVTLSPFFLDITEVTNQDFAAWLNQRLGVYDLKFNRLVRKGNALIVDLYAGQSGIQSQQGHFQVRPGFAQRPVVQVTWTGASLYCQSQGKRLPTEAEWEFAARGGQQSTYPWGEQPARCDGVAFGRRPGGACIPGWEFPSEVGSMPQDTSSQGVRDLGGNVEEWVLDRFVLPYTDCGTCKNPLVDRTSDRATAEESGFRVVRGGSYGESVAPMRAAGRSRWPEDYVSSNLGFRCATPIKQ